MFRRKWIVMLATAVLAVTLGGCGGPESSIGQGMPEEENAGRQGMPKEENTDGQEMSEEITGEQEMPEEETVGGQVTMREESSSAHTNSAEGNHIGEMPEEDIGEEPDAEADIGSIEPKLPITGTQLSDFVVEGWKLRDSVELDFNQDGIMDYVGVQEVSFDEEKDEWGSDLSLRILFAIASEGEGQYRLDFQDANLIRAWNEGGMMGDPYAGIEGEGTSFTTHAWGGSSDKWSEAFTYTYRDETWYLTVSEYCDGFNRNVDDYRRDDWDSGIHIRKTRGRTVNCTRGEVVIDPEVYELEYEMRLDDPITIQQASRRWWLTQYRITDWEVGEIVFAEGIELSEDRIRKPERAYYSSGCIDENYAIYSFSDKKSEKAYLALYDWQDRSLAVLAQEDFYSGDFCNIDAIGLYQDKIYYSAGIVKRVSYKITSKGETRIVEEDELVGQKVVRMNLDGSGKEIIFTYIYPGAEQAVLEEELPYNIRIEDVTISGGEIVLAVYISNEDDMCYYRMNVDGSELRKIGQVSEEFPWEES